MSVSFQPGNSVKFHILGIIEETAVHMLPKLRERTYLGVDVYEKNGQPLAVPARLEVGVFDDEIGDKAQKLNITHIWEATLKDGIARAQAEKAGTWTPVGSTFLDTATLRNTGEAVPAAQTPGAPNGGQQESKPAPK